MTKCTEQPTERVVRTMRFPVRADRAVHAALVAAGHVQREAYNRAIASQLLHRGRVDPVQKSPKHPHGILGQLTRWRNDDALHGPIALQRPAVRAAREACKRAWAHEAGQAARIADDIEAVTRWNAAHPDWDWGAWDRCGAQGRKDTPARQRPPTATDRFRDQRNAPDDHARLRRAKDGMRSIVSDRAPVRIDARTVRVRGIDTPITVKCAKGLPPGERMRSIRIVARGTELDMRTPRALRFEAHISVEIDVVEAPCASDEPVALDLGIPDLVSLSNGEAWSPPVDARAEQRLEKARETVDALAKAKRQGTGAWHKAIAARQKARRAVDGAVREAMRQYARSLAERFRCITVEALHVKAMTASARGRGAGVAAKRGLNRALQARRFATFVAMLHRAMEARGGTLLALPAAYSSMTCAQCGDASRKSRKGKQFRCVSCGHGDDADVNAARVMLQRARVYLAVRARGGTHSQGLDAVWECIARAREAVRRHDDAESQGSSNPANAQRRRCTHTTHADEGEAARRGKTAKRLTQTATAPPQAGQQPHHGTAAVVE